MAHCFLCRKKTDKLISLDNKLCCQKCYELGAENFIIYCDICKCPTPMPRNEKSVAIIALAVGCSREYIIQHQPTIITWYSGCPKCPRYLTAQDLYKIGYRINPDTFAAILRRVSPHKRDLTLLLFYQDYKELNEWALPGLKKVLEDEIPFMTTAGLKEIIRKLPEEDFQRVWKKLTIEQQNELRIEFLWTPTPDIYPNWAYHYCA